MGVWMCGCMDVWVYGYTSVGVYGYIDIPACNSATVGVFIPEPIVDEL